MSIMLLNRPCLILSRNNSRLNHKPTIDIVNFPVGISQPGS